MSRFSILLSAAVGMFVVSYSNQGCAAEEAATAVPAASAQSRANEYLITPESHERTDSEGVPLADHVWKRLGSGRYRKSFMDGPQGSNGRPEICFSPSGDTIYISGGHNLAAVDPETGLMRFEYCLGAQNITTRSLGEQGIRIDCVQRPQVEYVILEHGTGKELTRGQAARSDAFFSGRRTVEWIKQGPPPGDRLSDSVLRDVATGAKLADLVKADGWGQQVWPNPQENRFAMLASPGELRIFDSEFGKLLRSLPLGSFEHRPYPWPVWSDDGESLVVCQEEPRGTGPQKKYQLIEVVLDKDEPRTIVTGLDHVVNHLALSPDGKYVAGHRYGFHDRRIRADWIVCHRAGGEYCEIDTRPARTHGIFSPDSKSFWLVSNAGVARFDLSTKKFAPGGRGALMEASALQFSADGKNLHAAVGDEIWTWKVATGELLPDRKQMPDVVRQGHFVRCVAIDPDARGSVWTGEGFVRYVQNEEKSRFNSARHFLTPDRQQVVFGDYGGDLHIGDLRTGAVLRTLLPKARPRQDFLISVAPDNKTLAVVRDIDPYGKSAPLAIELWDLSRGIRTGTLKQTGNAWMSLCFSRDSRELAVNDLEKMTIWDVRKQNVLGERSMEPPGMHGPGNWGQWTPNLRRYLGYCNGTLFDALTGRPCAHWKCSGGKMSRSAFSPDGTILALSAPDGPVFLIDVYGKHTVNDPREMVEVSKLWADLASNDSVQAFQAIGGLIRRGDAAVGFLKQQLKQPAPADADHWISELNAKDVKQRDKAEQALRASTNGALDRLSAALASSPSPEQRARLEALIKQHSRYPLPTARLRELRCVEVLEAIGSRAAHRLLAELSNGPVESRLAREAKAAIEQARSANAEN